ncbi:MAG: acetolactate synthase [Tannerellaceae bacterium]
MTVKQISIFLENKSGRLNEILSILGGEQIKIIAATVADTSEFGILRMIVNDPEKAITILKHNKISANLSDVIAIKTDSFAGAFAKTIEYFSAAGVSIEYMYCFSLNDAAILILQTNNKEAALDVINQNRLDLILANDLKQL